MMRQVHLFRKNTRQRGGVEKKSGEKKRKGASPGIEPGPPAPKAGILPLNYKASTIVRGGTGRDERKERKRKKRGEGKHI